MGAALIGIPARNSRVRSMNSTNASMLSRVLVRNVVVTDGFFIAAYTEPLRS